MKDDQAHKLSTCESYSDPIPPAAAYHLVRGCVLTVLRHCLRNQRACCLFLLLIAAQERVLFSTNLILKYHRRVNDIINVQRHVRGFVARAKMRRLCPGTFLSRTVVQRLSGLLCCTWQRLSGLITLL